MSEVQLDQEWGRGPDSKLFDTSMVPKMALPGHQCSGRVPECTQQHRGLSLVGHEEHMLRHQIAHICNCLAAATALHSGRVTAGGKGALPKGVQLGQEQQQSCTAASDPTCELVVCQMQLQQV